MNEPAPSQGLTSLRILVLDDDLLGSALMKTYLGAMGHAVTSTSCVAHARERLETIRYDVFISDLNLPDGDGWELMQAAKFFHPLYALTLTGRCADSDRIRSESVGFRRHLVKPCKFAELDAALQEAASEMKG